MRLVVSDYNDTIRNIVKECKSNRTGLLDSPYITMDNLEYALNNIEKDRVHNVLYSIEENYKTYHRNDDYNVAHYMFKALYIMRTYPSFVENLSYSNLALLSSEIPFEVDKHDNMERLYALCDDDFLSYANMLSTKFSPSDTICSFLNHFEDRGLKIISKRTIDTFRRDELDALDRNVNKYYSNLNEMRGKVNERK